MRFLILILAVLFQISILLGISYLWVQGAIGNTPTWLESHLLAVQSIAIATVGGCLYCLRAVYINKCVHKSWDKEWETWYFLRPLTSAISGLAAFIFLNAGLIVLDADQGERASNWGFLAFSFIAGLNVDKFVLKIEDIAKSTFGIEKSRSSSEEKD